MRAITPLTLVVLLAASSQAKTVRFDMRDVGLRNVAQATSDTTIEKVVALSNAPTGWLELDPERLVEKMQGEFEIDVRTFNTGLGPRDDWARDKWLGATEHPVSSFTIGKVLGVSRARLTDGEPVMARIEGSLRLRGIDRAQPVLAKLVYLRESEATRNRLPGNLLRVSATFDLDTTSFQLAVPELFRGRVARFLQVAVDMVGTDRAPAVQVKVDGPK